MKIVWAMSSLMARASDSRPEDLGSMPVPPNTLRVHTECVLVKSVDPKVLWADSRLQGLEKISIPFSSMSKFVRWRQVVSSSIVPPGNFAELIRTVTCMVLKANDRRTSSPCHDEFRGPRSDNVR
ncbi:hypothetical protein TNCV_3182841 [Trichonephila clavipes]|uniref:Uncharacterized protein n=1 Tax=Trichonephila clavipes TaxID=2585209 RepID=A0A8X6SHS8_TRICX|nr:hypothetical protein TNCV_3182841 [Trichonephila clavipes]